MALFVVKCEEERGVSRRQKMEELYRLRFMLARLTLLVLLLWQTMPFQLSSKPLRPQTEISVKSRVGVADPTPTPPTRRAFIAIAVSNMLVVPASTAVTTTAVPKLSSDSAIATLLAADDALSSLLKNWAKSTIDCSVADVSRDLLESKSKDALLEKASTFALFDKDRCESGFAKRRSFVVVQC